MPLPLACTAHTTLLLLSISVQRDLKNTVWQFSPPRLGLPEVLAICPRFPDIQRSSPTRLPKIWKSHLFHIYGYLYIYVSYACTAQLAHTSLQQKLPTQPSLHPKTKGFLIKLSLEFGRCIFLDQSLQCCLTSICKHLQCFEVDLSHICGFLGLERVCAPTFALNKLLLHANGYTAHQPLMAKGYSLPEIPFFLVFQEKSTQRFNTLVDFLKRCYFTHFKDQHCSVWLLISSTEGKFSFFWFKFPSSIMFLSFQSS